VVRGRRADFGAVEHSGTRFGSRSGDGDMRLARHRSSTCGSTRWGASSAIGGRNGPSQKTTYHYSDGRSASLRSSRS